MITMIRQVLTIAEIVLHPSYTFAGSSHDIALLKVIACSYWQFDQYSFLLCLTLQVDINIPIVISLLFNTKLDFSKISETVNLNDWAPACLPTSVITIIFINIAICNLFVICNHQYGNYESTEVLFMRRWENFHSRGQISQARMVGCMVRNTYFKFTLKSHSTPLNVEWGLEIPLQSLGWGATSEGGNLADKLLELEVSNR